MMPTKLKVRLREFDKYSWTFFKSLSWRAPLATWTIPWFEFINTMKKMDGAARTIPEGG